MPPKTTPRKPKLRSVFQESADISPVYSVFPEQAARERALQGPAGRTRSRTGATAAVVPPPPTFTRTRTGRVSKARVPEKKATSAAQSTPAPASELEPEPEQSSINPVPRQDTQAAVSDAPPQLNPTPFVDQQPVASHSPPHTPTAGEEVVNGTAPTRKATGATSEDQPGSEGAALQREDNASSSGSGKRSADDDGDTDQGGSKKPRLDDESNRDDQDESQQAAQEVAPLNPCEAAAVGLARFRNASSASGGPNNVQNPVVFQQQLMDETVFRAVAVVTEAISEMGRGVQFSLVDLVTLQDARRRTRPTIPTTRPGNEVLIPWIPGDHHSSLYVVFRIGNSNTFTIGHHDSINTNLHRNGEERKSASTLIRSVLNMTGWTESGKNVINAALPSSQNATRQRNGWECGMHVVFSAWTYALGLQLVNAPQAAGANYTGFLQQGIEVIDLSLQGRMDSETIRAFLECFGFIRPGQTVPPERSFDQTVRMVTMANYQDHNAAVRIDTELDARRANGEDVPSLDLVRQGLAEFNLLPATLAAQTAQTLLDMLAALNDSMNPGAGSTGVNGQPRTGSNDNAHMPEASPVDPDELAITQALLDAAAMQQAVRSTAAGSAEPAANTDTTASSGTKVAGNENATGSINDPLRPSPDSSHSASEHDAPAPDAGAIGGESQQRASLSHTSPTPNEFPAPGGGEDSRGSTPGSLSSAGSDDGFFGTSHGPPQPADVRPVAEHADLASSREEEARRVALVIAAEQGTRAERALEARDAQADREESLSHGQGDDYDSNGSDSTSHPADANEAGSQGQGPQDDVHQDNVEQDNVEQDDDAQPDDNLQKDGFQQDNDAQQEDPQQEDVQQGDSQEQDNIQPGEPQTDAPQNGGMNDLFGDDESLFGDGEDPSPSPPARLRPSGLSLPPTPIKPTFTSTTPSTDPQSDPPSWRQRSPIDETEIDETGNDQTFADDDDEVVEMNPNRSSSEGVEDEPQARGMSLSTEAAAVLARWGVHESGFGGAQTLIPEGNHEYEDEREIGDGYESP